MPGSDVIGHQHLPLRSNSVTILFSMVLTLTSILFLFLFLFLILFLISISIFTFVSIRSVPIGFRLNDKVWLRLLVGIFAGGLEFRLWRGWRQLLGERRAGKREPRLRLRFRHVKVLARRHAFLSLL